MESISVTVPASAVGRIIGKQGSTIRDLQERNHCRIKVPSTTDGAKTVNVTIEGKVRTELAACKAEIETLAAALPARDGPRGGAGRGGGGGGGGGGAGEGRRERREGGEAAGAVQSSVTVDYAFVGRVIGKQGSNVRDIQDRTGCRIKIPSSSDRDDDTKITIAVSGPTDAAVHSAEAEIRAAATAPAPRPDTRSPVRAAVGAFTGSVTVASDSIGKVIGKAGSKIRSIQEATGCHLKVTDGDDGSRVVNIDGPTAEAVEEAERLVNDAATAVRPPRGEYE